MKEWTCNYFSQSNPSGASQGDPVALLRRLADSIEAMGEVWVQDIVYQVEQGDREESLAFTVYYHAEPRPGLSE